MGVTQRDAPISLDVRNARLSDVIFMLAAQSGENVMASSSVGRERVTLRIEDASFYTILRLLARTHGLHVMREGNVYLLARALPAVDAPSHVLPTLKRSANIDRLLPAVVIASSPQDIAPTIDSSVAVRSIQLQVLSPSSVLDALRDVLPAATYIADDRRKEIVIVGNASTLDTASALLKSLDSKKETVSIEVRLFDIHLTPGETDIAQELSNAPPSGAGRAMYALIENTDALGKDLRFLNGAGRATSLGSWHVASRRDRTVTVLAGDRYPMLIDATRVQGQLIPIGAELSIRSAPNATGIAALVQASYRIPERFAGPAQALVTRQRAFPLQLQEKQSIVLGGVFSDLDAASIANAPFLERLPVLGSVFAARRRAHIKDELCFIITPRFVAMRGAGTTQSFKQRGRRSP